MRRRRASTCCGKSGVLSCRNSAIPPCVCAQLYKITMSATRMRVVAQFSTNRTRLSNASEFNALKADTKELIDNECDAASRYLPSRLTGLLFSGTLKKWLVAINRVAGQSSPPLLGLSHQASMTLQWVADGKTRSEPPSGKSLQETSVPLVYF